MKELVLKARIENSSIKFYDERYCSYRLKEFEGSDVTLKISKHRPKRTLRQNNWYWGVACPIIAAFLKEAWGEELSKEDVHLYNLNHVTKPKVEMITVMGKQVVGYNQKRPSEMDTVEFNEFKLTLQAYWANAGCIIPDPNQKEFLNG